MERPNRSAIGTVFGSVKQRPTPPVPSNRLTVNRPDGNSADLVARCQAGDVDAFAELYRHHSPRIFALVCRMTGSTETGEDLLQEIFGDRLVFPAEFVGRGDMSRGGLLLRCVRDGRELTYLPLAGAVRHGTRPPRLVPRPRDRP